MVADVDALQSLYLRGLGPPLVALAAGAVAVGVAAAILPLAALLLAVGLLARRASSCRSRRGVIGRAAGRRTRPTAQGRLTAELVELLRGAPELVVYGREEEALERFRTADGELARLARRDALAAGVGRRARHARRRRDDGRRPGARGRFCARRGRSRPRARRCTLTLLALASFEAVTPLPLAARELGSTLAAGRRVLDLTDREPAVVDPPTPLSTPASGRTDRHRGVSARYSADAPPALEDFNLTLDPGRRVALVGPSGAGKTTVVNLLLRFLDPVAGRVTLGGHDLREYRQEDVRRAVRRRRTGLAPLLDEHPRERPPRKTGCDRRRDPRRAPAGADRRVGARRCPTASTRSWARRDTQLSGGQRQRLALARALLADAPVLVLDEPTAHLDPETAEALVADVLTAADGRSVLLITHRPEGLDLVDEIVTLG